MLPAIMTYTIHDGGSALHDVSFAGAIVITVGVVTIADVVIDSNTIHLSLGIIINGTPKSHSDKKRLAESNNADTINFMGLVTNT